MVYCGCSRTATPIRNRTALGVLKEPATAVSARFSIGEAVGYLVCDDYGYVFGAGKVTE